MVLERLDGTALKELHALTEILTLLSCLPHKIEFISDLLEHVVLLLSSTPYLFALNVVVLLFSQQDKLLELLDDELVKPLLVLLELILVGVIFGAHIFLFIT